MRLAQISDLHVTPPGRLAYGVCESNGAVERAVHALLRLDPAPDCVLVTGDLADCGLDAEYAVLRELLARLPMPVYVLPGNHDRREGLRRTFTADGYLPAKGPLNYAVRCGPLRIVALDSVVPGQSHGALLPETLAFLERALEGEPEAPTLVMLHHPPIDCGIAELDRIRLLDGAQEMERIVSAHPQVQRVLCGHVHRSVQRRFAGTLCQIAPSVSHQVALDLRPNGPSTMILEPPAFLLHWFDGAQIVTHTAMVDRAPGPFAFETTADYPGGPAAAA